jgi:hypothetical protein
MKIITISILVLFLFGCGATLPTINHVKFNDIKKVGIVSYLEDSPRHKHIGLTVFNNFDKELPYDWNLNDAVLLKLSDCIEAKRLTPVLIDPTENQYEIISNLMTYKSGQWMFVDKNKNDLERIKRQYDIDALVVVDQFDACVYHPCEINNANGYGLFTRGEYHFAYHNMRPITYYLNQPGWQGGLASVKSSFSTRLDRKIDITNKKTLSESDLKPVKNKIIKHINLMASSTCRTLLRAPIR